MMERLVLVVNTGGSEGFSMMMGIRGAGVFCTLTDAAQMVIPPEARGAVVIGENSVGALPCLRKLMDAGLPVLTFGAPTALLCQALGGEVRGHALSDQLKDVRFSNIGVCTDVEGGMRMLQSAEYLSLPQGCRTLCGVEGVILGFDDGQGKAAGFQFMPEAHDVEASEIIGNFLWNTLGLKPNYTSESYIDQAVAEIRDAVGDGQAVCVLSGGVDSTTAAILAKRAVGSRLHCLVIDKGLARQGDLEYIHEVLGEQLGLEIRQINAQGRMMEALRSCISPEEKRECVAAFIGDRVADEVARLGGHVVVIRATNYGDLLQGHAQSRLAGDIPVVEPLTALFKSEVRELAQKLNIPDIVVNRQHYPSAGIALRCMGPVDADKLAVLRNADEVLRQTLNDAGQVRAGSQIFAVLADFSVAFASAEPYYVVILRAVNGGSQERASVMRISADVLDRCAARVLAEVENVCRVVFDLTPVPPAMVEWE